MQNIEPDIFVLGFQEIDLSTEALLYAASSTKEEVWMTAITAALGEKGVLYEKVELVCISTPATLLSLGHSSWPPLNSLECY